MMFKRVFTLMNRQIFNSVVTGEPVSVEKKGENPYMAVFKKQLFSLLMVCRLSKINQMVRTDVLLSSRF